MSFRNVREKAALAVIATALFPAVTSAQHSFAPSGAEYRIAGQLAGDQTKVQVAFGGNRGLLIWQDNFIDQQGLGIAGQWVGAAGDPYLEKFRLNATAAGDQENARLAWLSNGNVIVVWQGGNGVTRRIYSRMLRADATFASATDVQISGAGSYLRSLPAVAALNDGRSIVVWESRGQDDPANAVINRRALTGIYARVLDAAGNPVGNEILVNTTVEFGQRTPTVAKLADGRIVIAWVAERLTGFGESEQVESIHAYGRIFSPDLAPLTGELRLNSDADFCANPEVAPTADGGFAAVWSKRSTADEFKSWDVVTRQFGANAAPLGAEFEVNTFTYGDQFAPRIAVAGASQMIVWTSLGQDGSWEGVFARVLTDGSPVGDEFAVNQATVSRQFFPAVASVLGNGFTVVWSSYVGGAGSVDLLARSYFQTLPSPADPLVTALSSYELQVSWAPVEGFAVADYLVYVNGSPTGTATSVNYLKLQGLNPGTTHSVRIAYRLADGSVSPLSNPATGRTWGADLNFDGLPDDWQQTHFGNNPAQWQAPLVDSDGDGASNLMEFLAGTDPRSAASVLRVSIQQTELGFRVDWNGLAGGIFQLQRSENFEAWTNVGGARFAAGAIDGVLTDGSVGMSYYRVIRVR